MVQSKFLVLLALWLVTGSPLYANKCLYISAFSQLFQKNLKYSDEQYGVIYGATPEELLKSALRVDAELQKKFPEYLSTRNFLEQAPSDDLEEISISWAENAYDLSTPKQDWGITSKITEYEALSDYVDKFNYKGSYYVARNMDQRSSDIQRMQEARVSVMADKVDRVFGYNVFPSFELVKLHGEGKGDAIVTPFMEGTTIDMKHRNEPSAILQILRLLGDGVLSKERLWTLQSLMFLVGNHDSEGMNIFYQDNGQLVAIDQGFAFDFGKMDISDYDPRSISKHDYAPMGFAVPEKYPRKFIEKLRKMTRDDWDDLLIDEALDQELDLMIYRQRFILEDVRIRGSSAIFED